MRRPSRHAGVASHGDTRRQAADGPGDVPGVEVGRWHVRAVLERRLRVPGVGYRARSLVGRGTVAATR
jgi:hypothetical protein